MPEEIHRAGLFGISELVHEAAFVMRRRAQKIRRILGRSSGLSFEETVKRSSPIISYEGNSFDLHHPRCTPEIGAAIISGQYEAREIYLIRRFVKPEDRVLELGACMGVTSLIIRDIVGTNSHVVIEADSRNHELSQHMFDLNQKIVRVLYGFLVSGDEFPREIEFASNSNPSSSSIFNRQGTEKVETVPTISFEALLEKEASTVLVLDIEGGEYDLFTKAKHFGSLRMIQLEAHSWIIGDEKMSEMLAALRDHGFTPERSYGDGRFLLLTR